MEEVEWVEVEEGEEDEKKIKKVVEKVDYFFQEKGLELVFLGSSFRKCYWILEENNNSLFLVIGILFYGV